MLDSLTPKRPQDSQFEKKMLFSQDQELRDSYVNFFGDLRFGLMLEELDMTAGIVAYHHADGIANDLTIVTAACDRIDLIAPLKSDADLSIQARVNWVGRSSMEIGVKLSSEVNSVSQRVARAYFIMVARKGPVAAPVNPLVMDGEDDTRRQTEGTQRQAERKALAAANYLNTSPTSQEVEQLHQLFLKILNKQVEGIPMADTTREATILMHPQNRNIHHKIFGGYLMRQCFELGWNIAYLFCRAQTVFVSVDHVAFRKPVEIGSIVSFDGQVIYTEGAFLMVEVQAVVIDPQTGTNQVANECFFTFRAVNDEGDAIRLPQILPVTYEEGLKYLDGAKRLAFGHQVRQSKQPSQS